MRLNDGSSTFSICFLGRGNRHRSNQSTFPRHRSVHVDTFGSAAYREYEMDDRPKFGRRDNENTRTASTRPVSHVIQSMNKETNNLSIAKRPDPGGTCNYLKNVSFSLSKVFIFFQRSGTKVLGAIKSFYL